MKTITSICMLWLLSSCAGNKLSSVRFMEGTWKTAGKTQYEVWATNGNKTLSGYSYKLNGNEKIITERLTIKKLGSTIVLEATVPDQNEGKTIVFILNNKIGEYLSFENLQHDFPKRIQYKRLTADEIEVTVSGDEGKAFSYKQLRIR